MVPFIIPFIIPDGKKKEVTLGGGTSRHCFFELMPGTEYKISVYAQLQEIEGPGVSIMETTCKWSLLKVSYLRLTLGCSHWGKRLEPMFSNHMGTNSFFSLSLGFFNCSSSDSAQRVASSRAFSNIAMHVSRELITTHRNGVANAALLQNRGRMF